MKFALGTIIFGIFVLVVSSWADPGDRDATALTYVGWILIIVPAIFLTRPIWHPMYLRYLARR